MIKIMWEYTFAIILSNINVLKYNLKVISLVTEMLNTLKLFTLLNTTCYF